MFDHTLLDSLDITVAALARWVVNSVSSDKLLEIVDPRYVKVLTHSRAWLSMEMVNGVSTFWPMTLVFFMLMVRPNS